MIYYLRERKRFYELQEIVGGVNPATLIQRLKTLERAGIVSEGQRHVEYEMTEKCKELLGVLSALTVWENRWYPEEER